MYVGVCLRSSVCVCERGSVRERVGVFIGVSVRERVGVYVVYVHVCAVKKKMLDPILYTYYTYETNIHDTHMKQTLMELLVLLVSNP